LGIANGRNPVTIIVIVIGNRVIDASGFLTGHRGRLNPNPWFFASIAGA
jgi:O6-methylguanine-DNA--protein-cysteine methyltransferase